MATGRGVFIVAAKRTAFGTFGGKLRNVSPTELSAVASKAALAAGGVDPKLVDSVIIGNVIHASSDAPYISRHAALKAGVPHSTPALTVNRLCGSGFQSVLSAAQEIRLGESNIVLTGGSESMSMAPFSTWSARWGSPLGQDMKLIDVLWAGLQDSYVNMPMAITAEKLGGMYEVTREQCDSFALSSQQRWSKADQEGFFDAEITPMEVKTKKGMETFSRDEHPRETTLEKLSKLPAVFKQDGMVTAGNASGVCDGACALVVASEEAVNQHKFIPLARLVGHGLAGVDPSIMGIGPAYAIRNLLASVSMTLDQIDLVEVNEAFAAQYLAVEKELGLMREKTNVNGGAITLGHPLAASGARITAHLVHELRRRGAHYAIGSACIGGGQGIALLMEKC